MISAARDRITAVAARVIASLPAPLLRRLAAGPVRIDGQELDPGVQLALRFDDLGGGWEPLPVERMRERRRRDARTYAGARIEVGRTEELDIPGPAGRLRARLYVPARPDGAPLVVYFHGGGHVICDLDTHDQPCRFLAREVAALVLSIDYRLGPEHRFPAAVEDAVAGFAWARAEAGRLGADPDRVAVAGDSAGANLAAVVCQLAAGGGGPPPVHQTLIYPLLDLSGERRSYELFSDGFFLTRAELRWFRDNYLARAEDRADRRASPILTEDLSGLPPAHLVTCGFDPLRDEGEEYAARLLAAGVPATLRRESDLIHGFINAVGLGGRPREAMAAIAAAMGEALATAPAPQRLP